MTIEPRPEHVDELLQLYRDELRLRTSSKRSSRLMKIAARIVARRTELTAEDFRERYVTTIGRRVFLPGAFREWSLYDQLGLAVHEAQHVAQYLDARVAFPVRYLSDPERRAAYEVEAMIAGEVVTGVVFGAQRNLGVFGAFVTDELARAYDVPGAIARQAGVEAVVQLVEVGEGVRKPPRAAQLALDWARSKGWSGPL